ncbi:MAG: hypothetical protein U0414_33600 [Polyangiaceae bacterium]
MPGVPLYGHPTTSFGVQIIMAPPAPPIPLDVVWLPVVVTEPEVIDPVVPAPPALEVLGAGPSL